MDIVYADADQFSEVSGIDIPYVDGDIIGINLPIEIANKLRIEKSKCVENTRKYIPRNLDYMIVGKFSNFPVPGHIPLTIETQRVLFEMVKNETTEISGIIDVRGNIINAMRGDVKGAPIQNGKEGAVSFHTHPKVSYEYYKTNMGWPSEQDTKIEKSKHLIPSLEGIYYITKPTTCKVPRKKGKKFTDEDRRKVSMNCSWIFLPWGVEWWLH